MLPTLSSGDTPQRPVSQQPDCKKRPSKGAHLYRGNQIAKSRFAPFCPAGLRAAQAQKHLYVRVAHRCFCRTDFTVRTGPKIQEKPPIGGYSCIGVTRFELMTFCSQSRRSTRLSYTPSECKYNKYSLRKMRFFYILPQESVMQISL